MEKSVTPLNGIVEPDFLEYLDKTFKRWQQLILGHCNTDEIFAVAAVSRPGRDTG